MDHIIGAFFVVAGILVFVLNWRTNKRNPQHSMVFPTIVSGFGIAVGLIALTG